MEEMNATSPTSAALPEPDPLPSRHREIVERAESYWSSVVQCDFLDAGATLDPTPRI
jgi:hypothetical protein